MQVQRLRFVARGINGVNNVLIHLRGGSAIGHAGNRSEIIGFCGSTPELRGILLITIKKKAALGAWIDLPKGWLTNFAATQQLVGDNCVSQQISTEHHVLPTLYGYRNLAAPAKSDGGVGKCIRKTGICRAVLENARAIPLPASKSIRSEDKTQSLAMEQRSILSDPFHPSQPDEVGGDYAFEPVGAAVPGITIRQRPPLAAGNLRNH